MQPSTLSATRPLTRRHLVLGVLLTAMGSISIENNLYAKETAAVTASSTKELSGKDKANKEKSDEVIRRSTAVTLNYCRASFYRIQKWPTYSVLIEEQEKILNNLDLNGIADQEVVKLYTAVLVEISELRLADCERHMIQERYQNSLGTVLTADAFDFGSELASAHYLAAVRTGARSWWDYRNVTTGRETDAFHVDQKRLMAFTEKSAQFLDTFWKLARDRKIPDRWLVRNQDLARLDAAMREPNLHVRLRVLKRMEEFMTRFPPYCYYVARTQQALGQLTAASCSYDKLLQTGAGHFRKDDMLAAGLANQAMIQDYLHQPAAVDRALKALSQSTDVWEANLMCAHVLSHHGRIPEAEDAVLRNLDVGLELRQSGVALVSLYTLKHSASKLQARLVDPNIVRRMPMPALIRAADVLGPGKLPDAVLAHWAASVAAHYELKLGPDEFVLDTAPLWNLQTSELSLIVGTEGYRQSTITLHGGKSEVRFAKISDIGHPYYPSSHAPAAVLVVKFPGAPIVRLKFDGRPEPPVNLTASSTFGVVNLFSSTSISTRRQNLSLACVEIGETPFPIAARSGSHMVPALDSVDTTAMPADSVSNADKPPGAEGSTPAVPLAPVVPDLPIPLLAVPKLPPVHTTLDGPKLIP